MKSQAQQKQILTDRVDRAIKYISEDKPTIPEASRAKDQILGALLFARDLKLISMVEGNSLYCSVVAAFDATFLKDLANV